MSDAAFQRPATSSSMAKWPCYFKDCNTYASFKHRDDDRYASPRIMRIPFNFLNRKSCAKHKLEGIDRMTRISTAAKVRKIQSSGLKMSEAAFPRPATSK
jgi:hypothetical protein